MNTQKLRQKASSQKMPLMCLNYVEGGRCSINGDPCPLGSKGASARNEDGLCEMQGKFDVWLTNDDSLLISDLGFPADEPKQCLALGINRTLAQQVAEKKATELGTKILTTKHECIRCEKSFWTTEHDQASGLTKTGQSYLCPECVGMKNDEAIEKRLGVLNYWCG
jgi:hypothetical protein